MSRFQRLLASSVGAKLGVAVTGVLLSLFVVGHLAGNLLVYKGRDAVNDYAQMLKGLGPWLWVIRAGLLAVFASHVALALKLRGRNASARPIGYQREATLQATFASRSMVLTGLLLLTFIVMHLAHFTLGLLEPAKYDVHQTVIHGGVEVTRHDVYAMVVAGFQNPLFVVLYVVAMALLALHLSHGLQSIFQTLGFRHPGYTPTLVKVCRLVAIVIALAYVSIPVTILLGLTGTEAASR